MKRCGYCGRENPDGAVDCGGCGTEFPRKIEANDAPSTPLSQTDRREELVTLTRCRTLLAADLIVGRLRAAGIQAFIPDESLMQTIGFNLNTYGYVRVQVSPGNYEAARELLGELDKPD